MGIYIKGMEMPTTCGSCWFCHAVSNEKWHCRLTGKSFASYSVGWGNENNTGENGQRPYIRRNDCPLIEVPEPHGRLIDADALMKRMWDETDCMISVPATFVRDAPTIIQSSEEAE